MDEMISNPLTAAAMLTALRSVAARQVAAFPQYAGHEAAYRLGKMRRTIKTKMGVAAERGELVLVKVEAADPRLAAAGLTGERTYIWSRRNAIATLVKAADVEVIA